MILNPMRALFIAGVLFASGPGCTFDTSSGFFGAADAQNIDGSAPPPDASRPDASADATPLPEPETIFALRHPGISIDGNLEDWQDYGWVDISAPLDFIALGEETADAQDLSARVAARWNDEHLYLAFDVIDDEYENNNTGEEIWEGDSIQVGFDMAQNGGEDYDLSDDWEYGWAIAEDDEVESHRWHAPSGQPAYQPDFFYLRRVGQHTIYEVGMRPSHFGLVSFSEAGPEIGFSFIVNDADGDGREGYLEWSSGIGIVKAPALFGTLVFEATGTPSL